MTSPGYTPLRIDTRHERPWIPPLPDGHLTAQCSFELDGGPACPACLAHRLRDVPGHSWASPPENQHSHE